MLRVESCLSAVLNSLGRHDEALVLTRRIHARRVATLGVSHESTIMEGCNLAMTLQCLELWDESATLVRDQLLPEARRSLGADHTITLGLNQTLADSLQDNDECTRDDLLEAETIMQDVVQRRRRVFGPAHPRTKYAEDKLTNVRMVLEAQ